MNSYKMKSYKKCKKLNYFFCFLNLNKSYQLNQVVLFELLKMNQNQNQNQQDAAAAMIAHEKGCAAADYGCCSVNDVKDRTVIFMRLTMKAGRYPDEEVKVSMCGFHYAWLVTTNKGVEPLGMCGKFLDTAIGEDLFSAFEPINPITRKSRLFTFWSNTEMKNHCIFNGNDVGHEPTQFERGWTNSGVIHYDSHTGVLRELEPISKEMCDIIAQEKNEGYKVYYYILPNEGVHFKHQDPYFPFQCDEKCWCLEVEDVVDFFKNPIELPDDMYNYVNSAGLDFLQKEKEKEKEKEKYEDYSNCLDFILSNVSEDIMKMPGLRTADHYDYAFEYDADMALQAREKETLFIAFETLMNLLATNDKDGIHAFRSTVADKVHFASLLWLVYTYTNHALYTHHDAIGKYNDQLVELFVAEGLQKQLLAIAISGERERNLDNHCRSHHNILYESEGVVKALVPLHVQPDDIIMEDYDNNHDIFTFTPVEYWHHFSNSVFNVCPPFQEETFAKNKEILDYLVFRCEWKNE